MEFNIKHFELSVREHWGLCNVHFFFLRKLTKYINVEEVTKSININRLGCVGGIPYNDLVHHNIWAEKGCQKVDLPPSLICLTTNHNYYLMCIV